MKTLAEHNAIANRNGWQRLSDEPSLPSLPESLRLMAESIPFLTSIGAHELVDDLRERLNWYGEPTVNGRD